MNPKMQEVDENASTLLDEKKIFKYLEENDLKELKELKTFQINILQPEYIASSCGKWLTVAIIIIIQLDLALSKEIVCTKEGIASETYQVGILKHTCYIKGPVAAEINVKPYVVYEYSMMQFYVLILLVPYFLPLELWDKCMFRSQYKKRFEEASEKLSEINCNFLADYRRVEAEGNEIFENLIAYTDELKFKSCLSTFKLINMLSIVLVYIFFFKGIIRRDNMEVTLLFYKFIKQVLATGSPLVPELYPLRVNCDGDVLMWLNQDGGLRLNCLLLNAVNYTILMFLWQVVTLSLIAYLSVYNMMHLISIWMSYRNFILNQITHQTWFKIHKTPGKKSTLTIAVKSELRVLMSSTRDLQ